MIDQAGSRLRRCLAVALAVGLGGGAVGCNRAPLSPGDEVPVRIRLSVTGGFAAADYEVSLDGSTGLLVGTRCRSLCDFKPGQVLQTLVPEQVAYLSELFLEAGIDTLDGRDFGVECCDQFYYVVDYRDLKSASRVRGSAGRLPPRLQRAVGALQGLVSGVLPLVVDLEGDRSRWPQDPLQILTPQVEGNRLRVQASYSGGCRSHDIQAVAWGGWIKTLPAQVRLLLAHEDFEDPCEALVQRELDFDLEPLRRAYEETFGVGEPGETLLVLWLEDPRLANPMGAWRLEYWF